VQPSRHSPASLGSNIAARATTCGKGWLHKWVASSVLASALLACVFWQPVFAQTTAAKTTDKAATKQATKAQASAASLDTIDIEVAPGDTLIGLQERLLKPGASWRQVQTINGVRVPRLLQPGTVLRIPVALLRQQEQLAEAVHSHGDVTVERAGTAPRKLVGGDTLKVGDAVRTGPQSSAALRFADGARVLVRPDSRLLIERSVSLGDKGAVDTQLRLDTGSADTQVPEPAAPTVANKAQVRSRLSIRTPVANLGVRGTEFRTRAETGPDGSVTAVEVLAGRVAAAPGTTSGAALAVDAGFGTTATPSGVAAPVALLPAPSLAQLPAVVQRLPLAVAWPALAGATKYRAQVYADATPDQLLLDAVVADPSARFVAADAGAADLPDGNYRLRVRGADAAGLEGRDATHRFTLKARPQPPFLNRPAADATTTQSSVVFAWTRNTEAARYRLQIAPTASFEQPVFDDAGLTAAEQTVQLPAGSYHWRVASVRANGDTGPWSDPQTLRRDLPPPPPPAAAPAAPASQAPQLQDGGMLLRWADTSGVSYRVQVSRDAGFGTLLVDERVAAAQWLLKQPEGGNFYVRVATINAAGVQGAYGDTQVVDVPKSGPGWWWLLLPALLLF
jgi:hypothetical protein